jgi:hypothetical protein
MLPMQPELRAQLAFSGTMSYDPSWWGIGR